jgi:putative ABC transport system ATP-binding protein
VPTTGNYLFRGVDVGSLDREQRSLLRRHYIGFVFQGFNLLSRTSALDNVELPLLYHGRAIRKADRHGRAMRALGWVGLEERAHHHPNQLSGGQQQRVAIARALINDPPILLADEPTGNLDTRTSVEVMGIFQRLNIERGITILLITHELDIAQYATRLIGFRDGRLVFDRPIVDRRIAADELEKLPPSLDEVVTADADGTPAQRTPAEGT